MTRPTRRSREAAARHDVREMGCTCTPTLIDVPRALWPEGVTGGHLVVHVVGCVLGDELLALNELGITPEVFRPETRCER